MNLISALGSARQAVLEFSPVEPCDGAAFQ